MTENVASLRSVKVATPPCAAKAAIPCGLAVRKQHEMLFAASKFEGEYNEFYGTSKSKKDKFRSQKPLGCKNLQAISNKP